MTLYDNGQDRMYRLLLDPRLDDAWREAQKRQERHDFWATGLTFIGIAALTICLLDWLWSWR